MTNSIAERFQPTLAIRTNPGNPNHHLFNNHGTWWCHYTIHRPDYTKQRVRISLRTRNAYTARRRRDRVLGNGNEHPELRTGGTPVPACW